MARAIWWAAMVTGLLAPVVAAAQNFGPPTPAPPERGLDYLIGRPQAETQRLQQENQMRQMDLEDRRAQRAMRCILPDGRRVECR